MRFTRIVRLKQAPKFDEIISSARLTLNEAPKFFNELKEDKKKVVYDKIIKLNNWYMKVIGIEEVKKAQDKVMLLQDELAKTREKYREVESKLNDVNLSRGEIHNEMSKVDKNVDFHRFIELRNQETEMLKLTLKLQEFAKHYSELEKEQVTQLQSAVAQSFEAQRQQVEYTKYIYAVMVMIGSFAAYQYRKEDIKRFKDLTLTSVHDNIVIIREELKEIKDKQNRPGYVSTTVSWIVWGVKYPYTYFTKPSDDSNGGTWGYIKRGAGAAYSGLKGGTVWLVKCIPGVSKKD